MSARSFDVVVAGGGLVGMSIAYGLAREGRRVAVCDGADSAHRAARGNFGLVWVQGKGGRCLPYAQWSRESSERWGKFAAQLQRETGVNTGFERPGGIELCETPAQLESAERLLASIHAQDASLTYEVLDRAALKARIPAASSELAGALYSPHDGHASPLYTLRGLISRISLRGQIMVTERLAPFLDYPTLVVRQTPEGSVLLGDSAEDVGFDDGQTRDVMSDIARRARTAFPMLAHARIVRAWGALRIMTPDGLPVYEESHAHPGAFLAICHSGVTLAAAHADVIAPWMAGGPKPAILQPFVATRFTESH